LNRDEKAEKVKELNETFASAQFAVVTDYRGLKVTELEKLRRELRNHNANIRVAKNTLLRLAVKGTDYEGLSEELTGTTAIALTYGDPVGSAKVLVDFAKDYQALQIRSGCLDGSILSSDDIVALSKLPGKDQLRAQFLGVLSAVPSGFVRVLNAVPAGFVYALQAIKDQKEN